MSIFDSIGQAFKYIVECYRMVLEEPKLLLPSLLSVVIGFFTGLVVLVVLAMFNVFGRGFLIFGGFLLISLFVSYAISYIFMASTAYAVYEHVKFGRSSLRKAFNMTLARAPTILMLALVAAIITVIVQSLKNSRSNKRNFLANLIAMFFAEALEEGWKIASMLLIPVAVIGGYGFTDTFKKAFDIAKNNLVLIGAGEVGIRILTGIFGFLGVLVSVGIAIGLFMLFSGLNVFVAIAIAVLFAFTAISLISTLNMFVRTSYYTLIYAWAEDRIEHGSSGPVSAPMPLKNAFGI